MTIDVTNAKGRVGLLLITTQFAYPTHLGKGCSLYLDTTRGFAHIGFVPNAMGRWSLQVNVPNVPALANFLLPMQAGIGPSSRLPWATDLTNAVLLAPR